MDIYKVCVPHGAIKNPWYVRPKIPDSLQTSLTFDEILHLTAHFFMSIGGATAFTEKVLFIVAALSLIHI